MLNRIVILILNLFFPPLAVALMTGIGSPETVTNALLFLVAIFPSYLHGFYVSWRYFQREENLEHHQWEAVRQDARRCRNRHRSRSVSQYSFSSLSSGSDDYSGKREWRGEVEEFSDQDHEMSRRGQRRPNQLSYHPHHPVQRIAGAPPPCPSPPTRGYNQRYLQ